MILWGGRKKPFPPLFKLLLLLSFLLTVKPCGGGAAATGQQVSGGNIRQFVLLLDTIGVMDGIAGGGVVVWCDVMALLTLPPNTSC